MPVYDARFNKVKTKREYVDSWTRYADALERVFNSSGIETDWLQTREKIHAAIDKAAARLNLPEE